MKKKNFNNISAYFNNQLKGKELIKFLNDLEQDQDLRREFELVKEVFEGLNDKQVQQFESKMSQVISEINIATKKSKNSIYRNKYLIAGIIIAVLIFLLILNSIFGTKKEIKGLYADYYEIYPTLGIQRSQNSDEWLSALIKYENGDYGEFIDMVSSFESQNNTMKFYLAIAHMELKEWLEAEKLLSKLSIDKQFIMQDASLWYLALIHLRQNEIELTKRDLRSLTLMSGKYSLQAKDLIGKLN